MKKIREPGGIIMNFRNMRKQYLQSEHDKALSGGALHSFIINNNLFEALGMVLKTEHSHAVRLVLLATEIS